jgi:peptidyl-prolyl cis-trans isomerase C
LGWIPVGDIPNTFVKPFGEAVLKLGKGQVSEPVQSQFGWHIIKLEDLRDLKIPPLEELKQQLTQRLQQQSVKQLITDLRSKAKVD